MYSSRLLATVLLPVAVLTSLLTAGVASAAAGVTLYSLPPATQAGSLAAGPEGAVWFTASHRLSEGVREGVVGRIYPDGRIEEFKLPPRRMAGNIAAGPDGNLWFAESFENRNAFPVARIGRLSPTGEFAEYGLCNCLGFVRSITAGPDEALWFTASYRVDGRERHVVGRIDLAGGVTRFHLPPRSNPGGIAVGPDGNLWFTMRGSREPAIGRITPRGRITRFPLPSLQWIPGSITAGPRGSLWFSLTDSPYRQLTRSRLGRITTTGSIKHHRVSGTGGTWGVAAGPTGSVWFITGDGRGRRELGWVAPGGATSRLACLNDPCGLVPRGLAMGPEGAPWFTAHGFYPHEGGGQTGFWETLQEEQEAGTLGRVDSAG